MRVAFIVSFAVNVLLALLSLAILPARVAIHFGPGGMPDHWAANYANSLMILGLEIVLFAGLYFAPRLILIVPSKWVNLPHKRFWLAPENRRLAAAKVSALICQFGVVIFLFLFVIGLLTMQANVSKPVRLNEHCFFLFLIPFLAYSIAWGILFFKSFRIPNTKQLADSQTKTGGGQDAASG